MQLKVRLQPRASRDRIVGYDSEGRLRIKVTAPPVGGAANLRLIELLSKWLGISKSKISIISGEKKRDKILHVEGTPKKETT